MIKILHGADFHLDSPFSGLDPERAKQMRKTQRQLLGQVAEICKSRGCQLVLLSGDLFDGETVSRDTVDALGRMLRACGVPVFLAPGNHDPYCSNSPYYTYPWPENTVVFHKQELTAVDLPELGCRVYGNAFVGPVCPGMLEGFHASGDGVNLMVLHGQVASGGPYCPISKEQIAASGLDYLALGHIHQRGGGIVGKTAYGWPGCLMGRGFDETGEKGVEIVTLDGGTAVTEFVPVRGLRYETVTVQADAQPLETIMKALPEEPSSCICRLIVKGRQDRVDMEALRQALRPCLFALELVDQTEPAQSVWDRVQDDTLRGLFLRSLQTELEQEKDPDIIRELQLAAEIGSRLFEGREVTLP